MKPTDLRGILQYIPRFREKTFIIAVDGAIVTTSIDEVLGDPRVEVVIELMGGEHPAREYIQAALESGRHVVTANKEVMAKCGSELLAIAAS